MVRKISKNYSNSDMPKTGSYPVFYAIGLTGHRLKISVLLLIDELNQIDFDGLLSRLGGVSRFVLWEQGHIRILIIFVLKLELI